MPDHRRMRRVENVEALASERALQDLGRERGAAHAEQDERLEARPRLLCELADLDNPLLHPLGLVEPAEPPVFVRTGPERGVARPDALDELLLRGDGHPRLTQAPAR